MPATLQREHAEDFAGTETLLEVLQQLDAQRLCTWLALPPTPPANGLQGDAAGMMGAAAAGQGLGLGMGQGQEAGPDKRTILAVWECLSFEAAMAQPQVGHMGSGVYMGKQAERRLMGEREGHVHLHLPLSCLYAVMWGSRRLCVLGSCRLFAPLTGSTPCMVLAGLRSHAGGVP